MIYLHSYINTLQKIWIQMQTTPKCKIVKDLENKTKSMLMIIRATVCAHVTVLTVVLSLDWCATLRGWWLSIPVKKESCCNDQLKPARGDICEREFSHTYTSINVKWLDSPNVDVWHHYWKQIFLHHVLTADTPKLQRHPVHMWNITTAISSKHT